MVSAMTEGVKNKNRGMQVVKLHVPFLFLLHTVRYQSHRMPRIEPWEQTKTTAHLKKREWNGGIGVCAAMKAPVGLLSHKAVLRKQDVAAPPRQTWGLCTLHKPVFHRRFCRSICFSGATWLDSSNLVARTEYHSRLVLSTLILRFFSQNRCTAGISALFLHSAQRKPLALAENPLVFYCILKWFLLL